jgi:hypothetical protein
MRVDREDLRGSGPHIRGEEYKNGHEYLTIGFGRDKVKSRELIAPVAQGIEHNAPDAKKPIFQDSEIIDFYLISFEF